MQGDEPISASLPRSLEQELSKFINDTLDLLPRTDGRPRGYLSVTDSQKLQEKNKELQTIKKRLSSEASDLNFLSLTEELEALFKRLPRSGYMAIAIGEGFVKAGLKLAELGSVEQKNISKIKEFKMEQRGNKLFSPKRALGFEVSQAIKSSNYEAVKELIEKKAADPSGSNLMGVTHLSEAIINGEEKIFDYLLEAGARLDNLNVDSTTALHQAVMIDNVDIVKKLLEKKADITGCAYQTRKFSPLAYASYYKGKNSSEIIKILRDAAASDSELDNSDILLTKAFSGLSI